MPERFVCPQEHCWEVRDNDARRDGEAATCPICGADGDTLPPGDSRTTTFLQEDELPPPPKALPRAADSPDKLGPAPEKPIEELPEIPGYQLLDTLGRGGMGVVYRARQLGLDRLVAIKTVLSLARADAEVTARLQSEAESVARLNHLNIAQVYEVGEFEGAPFFAMELVTGGNLAERIRQAPLSVVDAARLTERLAQSMDYAHSRGVVHRDLKPANVLLTDDETPKITDFGLAKRLDVDRGQTRTGMIMGSPGYMAPEQAEGQTHAIGPLSDVYSLGAVLYDMLAGRPPFRGETPWETLRQVVERDPVAPHLLNPQVPRDLETICLKCLDKDASKRYQSAGALAEELRRFLNDEPIQARPIGAASRVCRWCRRKPAVASLAAVAVACLLIALIASTVGYLKTQSALTISRTAEREADRSFRDALDAVNNFYTRVSEDTLLNQPGMQPLKEKLLRQASDYYERFLDQRKDDPTLRHELALAQFRVGEIVEELGSLEEAAAAFQRALTMLEQPLTADGEEDVERLKALGDIWNASARVSHKLHQLEQAFEAYGEAIRIRDRLAANRPTSSEALRKQANSYMNVGLVERDRGNIEEAIRRLEQAQTLRQQLLETAPDAKVQRDLAIGFCDWANLCFQLDDVGNAAKYMSDAARLFEDLLAKEPDDLRNHYCLAVCYRCFGDFEETLAEAEQWYEKARESLEPLARQNPAVADYQEELGNIYFNLGGLAFEQQQLAEAAEWLEQAEGLLEDAMQKKPGSLSVRRSLDGIQRAQDQVRQRMTQQPDTGRENAPSLKSDASAKFAPRMGENSPWLAATKSLDSPRFSL